MAKYLELAFALSAKTDKSLGSAFKSVEANIGELNKKIASLEKSRGEVKRFEGLRKDIIKTNREYNEAQKKVNALAKEMKNTTDPSRKLQDEFKRAQKEASNLKHKLEDQKDELRQLKGSMNEAGVSTKNFAKDQAKLEETLNKTIKAQRKLQDLDTKLDAAKAKTSEARGKLVDAAAMAATVAVPVKLAMDAEETMADINKVADFDSPEELKELEKKIMEMNTKGKIPMSFNQLGQIVASGAQAGIDKLELPDFASDAAKMGIAFDIEAEEAGQVMAGWRSAFGMNQKEVINLADKVNYLGNTTAASAPLISDFVTRVGALGEVGGVQSGEIAALGATLISMNIPAEVAATSTNKLISTLNKGESATKKQQAVFKKLGFSATDMAKRMQTDAKGAIIDVLQALEKLPEYEKTAALNDLFGETGTKAVAPLLNNIQLLEENLSKVDETQGKFAGSMEAEFQTRVETSANSLQLLKNNLENVSIILGSVLLPPIVTISEKLGQMAFKVQELAQKYPNLTKFIVMGTAAFLGFNVAMTAGKYITALTSENILSLRRGLLNLVLNMSKSTAGQWALNVAMSANPIGIVIALIAGLVAILAVLYNKSETVRTTMDKMWNGMKNGAVKAINTISEYWQKLKELLSKPIKAVVNIFKRDKGGKDKKDKDIPGYATGGIVTTPQLAWLAEGGVSEAIIPLEKTANSMSLWERAGRALGVNMSPKGIDIASGSVDKGSSKTNAQEGDKYEFNFNIDAKGAAPGVEKNIKDALLQEVIPIIMRILDDKEKDKLRVSIS